MEGLYWTGVMYVGHILGVAYGIYVLSFLSYWAYLWVNDKRFSDSWIAMKMGDLGWSTDNLFAFFVLGSVLMGVLALFWPLTLAISIIATILHSLRGFVRFQKKVDKALDGKSNTDHAH